VFAKCAANYQQADQSPSSYVSIVYLFSTLLAMWGFAIVFDLCKAPLTHIHITPKFFCLQLVLVIVGLQQSVVSVFQVAGIIVCDPPLPAEGVANRK
jgi:Organic solute transporter Ostalpha